MSDLNKPQLIGGIDTSGNLVPVKVAPDGSLGVSGSSGTGGASDATAANQQTEILRLEAIRDRLPLNLTVSNTRLLVDTGNTSTNQVTGNVASGVTDSGNPVKIGGIFNATLPTLTNGQRGDSQLTNKGELLVAFNNPASVDTELPSAISLTDVVTVPASPTVGSINYTYNTATNSYTRVKSNNNGILIDGSAVTQPISAASLPLPANAATAGLQTGGNISLNSIDGKIPALGQALSTASIPVVLPNTQINALTPLLPSSLINDRLRTQTILDSTTITGTANSVNALIIPSTDISNYSFISLQLTGTYAANINFEFSNDNTNWELGYFYKVSDTTVPYFTVSSNGIYYSNKQAKYFRVKTGSYTSGTINGTLNLSTSPFVQAYPTTTISGTPTVNLGGIAGVATENTLAGINAKLPSTLLGDRIKTNTVGASLDLTGSGSSNVIIIPSTDITDYSWVGFQLSGTWSANILVEFSDNNTAWHQGYFYNINVGSTVTTTTINGVYTLPKQGKYLRISIFNYNSGTVNISINCSNNNPGTPPIQTVSFSGVQPVTISSLPATSATSILQTVGNNSLLNIEGKIPNNLTVTSGRLLVDTGSSGSNQVTGNTASATTDSGNPVKIGGVYNSTAPAFTSGQRGDIQLTSKGELITTSQDIANSTASISVQDTASVVSTGANGQSIITGVATTSSTASIAGTGTSSFAINVSGTFTGTLQFERSLDNNSTWTVIGAFAAGTNYTTTTTTTIGNFHGNSGSCTNIRVRAISAITGTAQVKIILGVGTGTITVGNGIRSFDKVSGAEHTIKPANVLPVSTDTATVVTLRELPNITIIGSGSATDALVIPVTDCINYRFISLQLTGTWAGSVIFEWSNNNIDWISGNGSLSNLNNSTAPTSAASINSIFNGNIQGRYFRARLQSYTSGTVNAAAILSAISNQVPYPTTTITGTPTVNLFSNVVDTELPTPISLVDGLNLSNSPSVINAGYLYNPSTGWERARTSGSGRALVDGSGVTQPISATSLPLPTLAATSTLQGAGNTALTNIQSRLMPAGSSSNLYTSLGTVVSAVIKSSAGSIYSIINSLNTTTTVKYIQFFNSTILPSNGATPLLPGFPIPPNNGLLLLGQDVLGGEGIYFSAGISFGISTTPLVYTAASASDVGLSIRYL